MDPKDKPPPEPELPPSTAALKRELEEAREELKELRAGAPAAAEELARLRAEVARLEALLREKSPLPAPREERGFPYF